MVRKIESNGNTSFGYQDLGEFINILNQERPNRVFTYTSGADSGRYRAAFVDKNEDIHGFATEITGEFLENSRELYDLFAQLNIKKIDGEIGVDPKIEEVSVCFLPGTPETEEQIRATYSDWRDLLSELPLDQTTVQYMTGSVVLIDATWRKFHHLFVIDDDGVTLEEALQDITDLGFTAQDNTPAVKWYFDIVATE